MNNSFKMQLKEGKPLFGAWVQIAHPDIAEILADKGFDWICADMEHTAFETRDFSSMAQAVSIKKTIPFARVAENEKMAIRRVLDAGAQGVIVPFVNNKKEAGKAVSAAKFPPDGIRGFSFCRANGYGERFEEYARDANDNIVVIVMIESKEALDNIDEILDTEGVDGVFIGPYDMSGSYGVVGKTSHPVIEKAIDIVATSCKRYGKTAGIHIVDTTEKKIKNIIKKGYTFIALATDTVFLRDGAEKVLNIARGGK